MRNFFIIAISVMALTFMSCTRVEPNYIGVRMTNFGKNGKSDYTLAQGNVNTFGFGTKLFQVPTFEQRGSFGDRTLHLKAADNTEFTAKPLYSYEIMRDRTVDIVFQNARLESGDEFMRALEDNIIEPHIYDLMKEASLNYTTEALMTTGGLLKFEKYLQGILTKAFEERGLILKTFSTNMDFSKNVRAKIDSRNTVSTNISLLDQQILQQQKINELARLRVEENRLIDQGLTKKILVDRFIQKWDGKTPLYGDSPIHFIRQIE